MNGATPFLLFALLASTCTSASLSVYIALMGVITFVSALVLRETRTKEEISGGGPGGTTRTESTTGMASGDPRTST